MKLLCTLPLLCKACLLALFCISSCRNSKDPLPGGQSCRLAKEYSAESPDFGYTTHEYDAQGRLIRSAIREDANTFRPVRSYIAYTYNGSGQLVERIDSSFDSPVNDNCTYTFEYNAAGKIQKYTKTAPGNPYAGYEATIAYDSQQYPTKITKTSIIAGRPYTYITVLEYQDGNLVQETTDVGGKGETTLTYTYDTAHENQTIPRPVHNKNEPGYAANKNLLTGCTIIIRQVTAARYTFDHEFNRQGLVTKRTSTYIVSDGSSSESTLFEYVCP
jgi:hypothetical protein